MLFIAAPTFATVFAGYEVARSGYISSVKVDVGGGVMAELTKLEAKLGEVTGLAMAAQAAGSKVMTLAKNDEQIVAGLEKMRAEAAETEERCTSLAGTFEGKKTAILEEARSVKAKGAEMMRTYLDEDAEALDGFEFLTMAEAGEVGHWKVLKALNAKARHTAITELVEWALPIQERHLSFVQATSAELADEESPHDPA